MIIVLRDHETAELADHIAFTLRERGHSALAECGEEGKKVCVPGATEESCNLQAYLTRWVRAGIARIDPDPAT